MNGYFASVELLDHPELINEPMAVAGNPNNRHGIILAKNEIAKKYGIVTAETIMSAMRKCPDLKLVEPHHEKYKQYSDYINEIYLRYTDMVEPFSIDESWLDVTHSKKLYGNGTDIANEIRRTVKSELGLTLSAGVSYNKIFAKMGSEYRKPDATTIISENNYKTIIWPMNIEKMFYVGAKTAEKLRNIGINNIGELALCNRDFLQEYLGKAGPELIKYANGEDESPVSLYSNREKIKSVGNGITFAQNLKTREEILKAVTGLSDLVAFRLRRYGMKCSGVKVEIKNPYFKTISRQRKLDNGINTAQSIKRIAMDIIDATEYNLGNDKYEPIRLISITGIGLKDEKTNEQLSFFTQSIKETEREEAIERAMDEIREKYGKESIKFAQLI
jgi:DNA polymerase-4